MGLSRDIQEDVEQFIHNCQIAAMAEVCDIYLLRE
jgi:signal transduction protein with GAF and PtsI domain